MTNLFDLVFNLRVRPEPLLYGKNSLALLITRLKRFAWIITRAYLFGRSVTKKKIILSPDVPMTLEVAAGKGSDWSDSDTTLLQRLDQTQEDLEGDTQSYDGKAEGEFFAVDKSDNAIGEEETTRNDVPNDCKVIDETDAVERNLVSDGINTEDERIEPRADTPINDVMTKEDGDAMESFDLSMESIHFEETHGNDDFEFDLSEIENVVVEPDFFCPDNAKKEDQVSMLESCFSSGTPDKKAGVFISLVSFSVYFYIYG